MVLIFNTINFYINWLTVTKLGQATVAVAKEMAPHIRKHGQKLLPDSIKSKTPAPGSNSKVDKVVDGAVEVAASGLKGKWLKSIISTSISCGVRICVYCIYIYIYSVASFKFWCWLNFCDIRLPTNFFFLQKLPVWYDLSLNFIFYSISLLSQIMCKFKYCVGTLITQDLIIYLFVKYYYPFTKLLSQLIQQI